jgi:virginiamycin B lyase
MIDWGDRMTNEHGYRLPVTIVPAVLAAGLSACSGAGNTVPTAIAPAVRGDVGLPFARERVKIKEFADLPQQSGFYSPQAVASGPKRSLWVTDDVDQDVGESGVVQIATSGSQVNTYYYGGVTSEGSLFTDITEGPDHALWMTDEYNRQVLRMTPTGTYTGYPLNEFMTPLAIASGPDGALWFTESGGSKSQIGRITTSGQISQYGASGDPLAIAVGSDKALWFTELQAGAIGRITTAGKVTVYSKGITPGSNPYWIAAGPDGALWFTELGGRIGRITTRGKVTEFAHGITPTEEPIGIAAGPDAAMWFTESERFESGYSINARIGRITMNGKISEYDKFDTSSNPTLIAEGPDKNMWFVASATDRTGRVKL